MFQLKSTWKLFTILLIDNFEMVHEDVVLRLFSKSLVGDAALWFKNLEYGSIGSWSDLYNTFSRS